MLGPSMVAPEPSAVEEGPRCRAHRAAAGWGCSACGQRLCPDCVAEKVVHPATVTACVRCGGLAEPLLRHRREAASLSRRLPGALAFPFRGEGLIAWLALGLLPTLLSYLQFEVLGAAIMAAALFGVMRSTGRGADRVELSDFVDPVSDFLLPTLRFALVTAPVWAGVAAARWLDNRLLLWASLLLGALWVPSALLVAAASTSVLVLLNPLAVLGTTRRLGADFLVYAAGLGAAALLMVPAVLLALALFLLPLPFLSRLAAFLVVLYPPLLAAHLGGLVLYLHGDALGFGRPEEYLEPRLGMATPRGVLPEALPGAGRVDYSPIEVAAEAGPGPTPERAAAAEERPRRPAALDLGALPSAESQAAQAVREAMAADDVGGALEAWRSWASGAAAALSCQELTWVGRAAASRGDLPVAEAAFRAAATRSGPQGALAGARVMLARLLDERLARPADARAWMQRVAGEHPGTDAGRFAAEWLAKRSGG